MDFTTFWKLLGLGMEADFAKKTWSIVIGPFKATGLALPTIKALSSNPSVIERLLSDLFIKPAVMWMDFRRETVSDCIHSLTSLEKSTAVAAHELSTSSKHQDRLLSGLLQVWSGECKQARGRLEAALEDERDPINTGLDISARDEIAPALGEFRRSSFPAVKLLIDLLPDSSPIRAQAIDHLRRAEDELVRFYGIAVAAISPVVIEPE